MQEQGAHHQHFTHVCKTGAFIVAQCDRVLRRDGALEVRSRHDVHWAVIGSARVKVQTHRDYLLQQAARRLNVPAIFLARPTAQGRILDALAHWNAQVLMHRHQPVH